MKIVIVYLFTLIPALTFTLLIMAMMRLIFSGVDALLAAKLRERKGAGLHMT